MIWRAILIILTLLIVTGCGASYHYYAPPVNNSAFANKNETHLSGNAGITGTAVKFGYAVSNKTSLLGTYHFSSPVNYRGSEFESALMFRKPDSTYKGKNIVVGCGFGNNYEQMPEAILKNFRGSFIKPFAMITFGSADKKASIGKYIYIDAAFCIKINYLIYNGYKATTINNAATEKKFNANIFFAEPYFNFNLGTKWLRIGYGLGCPIKKKYDLDKNLSVFPFEMNVGIAFIFGRKYINNSSYTKIPNFVVKNRI